MRTAWKGFLTLQDLQRIAPGDVFRDSHGRPWVIKEVFPITFSATGTPTLWFSGACSSAPSSTTIRPIYAGRFGTRRAAIQFRARRSTPIPTADLEIGQCCTSF